MENPFAFGRVVRGENFCNRKEEMELLRRTAKAKGSLIVLSPRRYGKTSLVINALEKHKIPFIFVDCFEIATEAQFLEKVTSAYLQALQKGDVLEKLKAFSKSLHIEYSFSAEGIQVKVHRVSDEGLRVVLEEATKKHLFVLDEFQELFVANPLLVKKLRSICQFLSQSIIFLGSKKHLLLYLFTDQRSPFYNFGSLLYLQKILDSEWKLFIKEKFKGTKITITEEEIQELLLCSDLIPFYVQYLFYHYWEEKRKDKQITPSLFLERLEQSHAFIYDELYLKLAANQKKALRILLLENGKVFSGKNIVTFEMSSPQALQKALSLLCEKGILEKNGEYSFNDPLFKQYLHKRFLT